MSIDNIRRIVREEIGRSKEREVFFISFILGVFMVLGAAFVVGDFWKDLLLNIGSNMVVFVLIYWTFQYFTGRQPGNNEDISDLQNALIETTRSKDRGNIPIYESRESFRRRRKRKYSDNDYSSFQH